MKQIIELEDNIKTLADNSFSANKYYTDLLAVTVIDRSLKLSKGFRCLIETKNSQCAITITRCQIDNLARLHGINLVPGMERIYVYTFLDPEKK